MNKQILQVLKNIEKRLGTIEKNSITKDDIKNMVVKDDIKNMATKSDIRAIRHDMATKDDIKNMVVKDDIKNMVVKDDIKNMATKDDIKNMATKDDIKRVRNDMVKMEKRLNRKSNKDKKELVRAIANVAVNSPTLRMHEELEQRVSRVEYH